MLTRPAMPLRLPVGSVLTALSGAYIAVVALLFGHVSLRAFNVLLVTVSVPMVRLIYVFCRWSAYQHARRWARDIEKVHGPATSRYHQVGAR